jgi:hypothetical protein
MSLMRRVPVLGAAVLLAVLSASAQSSISPNESSSASYQIAAFDNDAVSVSLFPAPAAGGAGNAQAGAARHSLFSLGNIAAEAGAGFNAPIGNDGPFLTWGGNFTGGAGLHLSKRLSVLAEYQFADNKLPGAMIAAVGAQGGNAHIWSLTLDPVIDLTPRWKNGAYITGGGGFYRKVTTFTSPEEVEECDPYYGCGIYYENGVVGHYSSNQLGANVGFGITHRLGGVYGDGSAKLFAETRYTYVASPRYTPAFTIPIGTTGIIPVTVGIRW